MDWFLLTLQQRGLAPNVQCSGTLNCIVSGAQSSSANQRPVLEAGDQWEAAMEAPLAQYIAETVTKQGFMWRERERAMQSQIWAKATQHRWTVKMMRWENTINITLGQFWIFVNIWWIWPQPFFLCVYICSFIIQIFWWWIDLFFDLCCEKKVIDRSLLYA